MISFGHFSPPISSPLQITNVLIVSKSLALPSERLHPPPEAARRFLLLGKPILSVLLIVSAVDKGLFFPGLWELFWPSRLNEVFIAFPLMQLPFTAH